MAFTRLSTGPIVSNRIVVRLALAAGLGLMPQLVMAQTIQGTATYRERMALPPGAALEVTLEEVSRADAPAVIVASTRVTPPGNPPIAFTVRYDPMQIVARNRYHVRARIVAGGALLFTSDTATPVITQGNPTTVSMMLRRVPGSGQTTPVGRGGASVPPASSSARPLQQTYWRAIELGGKPTPAQDSNREAHLQFQGDGRIVGSDGCNRIMGSYQLNGASITFGQMAGTQMACLSTSGTEGAFRAALKSAARWQIVGDRLELFDAAGVRLAAFVARAEGESPSASSVLQSTSWRLVRFEGGDDTTLTPDDPSKYTIEFGADGNVAVRLDCNRGRGSWTSSGPSQLQFGPLATTRAMCAQGSLHDRILKHWAAIRSYVLRDGHLFLSLMADGGIYEFEPAVGALPQ